MKVKRLPKKKIITYLVFAIAFIGLIAWRLDLALSKGYDTMLEVIAASTETYVGGIQGRRTDQKIRLNAIVNDGQGKPLSTQEIFAEIIEGEGIIEMWNKFTDNRGISTFDYISGTNAGQVKVSVTNLSSREKENVLIELNVIERDIVAEDVSMEIIVEPEQVKAGDIAEITVRVTRAGTPLEKHTIEFNVVGGKGNFRLLRQQVVDTDANGEAKANYTTSRISERSIILIRVVSVNPPWEENLEITTVE